MPFRFSKHYTVEEARALLPQIRKWLEHIDTLHHRLNQLDKRMSGRLTAGEDIGGESVNTLVKTLADFKEILEHFRSREIQIKDLERGLIDFPALRDGREIFLCWEKDDEDIEFWHDLESGYAGRERL